MTALGQILAGGHITASLVRAVAPLAAYKGADQSVTSSTTLAADSALFLPVAANATYLFACYLDYEGAATGTGDIKWDWALPAGASARYSFIGVNPSPASVTGNSYTDASVVAGATAGSGNLRAALMTGTLAVSSTAGNMQLQWAQNTSSATATTVHAGSVLAAWQIA